jgi:hypothetical protein
MTSIDQTPYPDDLILATVTHEELESAHGSCAACPDDETRHLLVEDVSSGHAWALMGSRDAVWALVARLTDFARDGSRW